MESEGSMRHVGGVEYEVMRLSRIRCDCTNGGSPLALAGLQTPGTRGQCGSPHCCGRQAMMFVGGRISVGWLKQTRLLWCVTLASC